MKILKIIFELLSKKSVRFLIGFIVFMTLIIIGAKEQYIDKEKAKDVIKTLKTKDKKDLEFIFNEDKKKETLNNKKDSLTDKEIVKKEIQLEQNKEEENIENTTNLFLVLYRLDEIYKDRLKNNKIDLNRRVKDGDYIYISLETDFLKENEKPTIGDGAINFFIKMTKKDNIYYDLLINKKVGYKTSITVDKLFNTIDKEDIAEINKTLNDRVDQINNTNTNINVEDEIKKTQQTIIILDFIPKEAVNELNLKYFN